MRDRVEWHEVPIFVLAFAAAVVIVLLIGIVVWSTFLKGMPGVEAYFSLDNYREIFFDSFTVEVAVNTVLFAVGSSILNLCWALPLAWLIHRANIPLKNFFLTLMFLPVMIPGFLKTMGWIMLASPKIGLINQLLRNFIPIQEGPFSLYNMWGMIFIEGLSLTPPMFFMISGAFLSIDPAFEEAAAAAGASKFKIFRRITLPLVMPAVVAAMIFNFMTVVGIFEVPALIGKPAGIDVFSTTMYKAIYPDRGLPNYGAAGVYGLLVAFPTVIALYYYQKLLRLSHRYATVSGQGYKQKLVDLGRFKWAGVAFIGIFFLLDLVLPLLSLAWASLMPHLQLPSIAALKTISFEGYRSGIMILKEGKVIANTVVLVGSSVLVALLICIAISWIVLRTQLPGRMILDTISAVPHAVPGIAIAFAISFLGLLTVKYIPLYGSLGALVLCYIVSHISFGTRAINGALIQIHKELEEAVLTSGGNKVVAIRKVILPLLAPVIFYVSVWKGLLSFREVTKALFLQSPRNIVLSTLIWQVWQSADTRAAGALGMIMLVIGGTVLGTLLVFFPQVKQRGGLGK